MTIVTLVKEEVDCGDRETLVWIWLLWTSALSLEINDLSFYSFSLLIHNEGILMSALRGQLGFKEIACVKELGPQWVSRQDYFHSTGVGLFPISLPYLLVLLSIMESLWVLGLRSFASPSSTYWSQGSEHLQLLCHLDLPVPSRYNFWRAFLHLFTATRSHDHTQITTRGIKLLESHNLLFFLFASSLGEHLQNQTEPI